MHFTIKKHLHKNNKWDVAKSNYFNLIFISY